MRIECSQLPGGRVYRIYRSSDAFRAAIRRFIPFVIERAGDTAIGGTPSDPALVLAIGPLDAAVESRFNDIVRQHEAQAQRADIQ